VSSARRLGLTPLRKATEAADKEFLDAAIAEAVQAVGPTKSRGTAADWLGAIAANTMPSCAPDDETQRGEDCG